MESGVVILVPSLSDNELDELVGNVIILSVVKGLSPDRYNSAQLNLSYARK